MISARFRPIGLRILLTGFLLAACTAECTAVTLVSRSAGLEVPIKEEGNTEFEFGDVNGDGQLDLVSVGDHGSPYVNSDQHGIMVWLGNGAGSWSVHQVGNFGYGGCALGDLNLDGLTDVAWGVHHNWGGGMGGRLISAAVGDGSGAAWSDYGEGLATGGENWGMFATALADFDGDGLLDIASQSFGGSNGIRVYRNHGDGTWSQAYALVSGSVGYTLEAADVNADGYLDLITTRAGTNILLGDGQFGFTESDAGLPGSSVHGIAVGDINADGLLDISFGYGSNGVRCYTFDGVQWHDASAGLPVSAYHDLTQLGDIDGDGLLDLVAYDPPLGRVYLGDGGGQWTADATWQMPAPGDASALRVDGDMDHDGREDIAVSAVMSGFPFNRNQLRVYSPWSEPGQLAIRVVFPQGGETLRAGSVRFIRWLTAVPPVEGPATVDLELSVSGPGGPWTSIATALPDHGRYQWTVDSPAASADARLRVTVRTVGGSASAVSPRGFVIVGDFSALEPDGLTPLPDLHVVIVPNPAREVLTVRAQRTGRQWALVTLHDLSGRCLSSRLFSPGMLSGSLPLRNLTGARLPAGRYFLRVRTAGQDGVCDVVILPN